MFKDRLLTLSLLISLPALSLGSACEVTKTEEGRAPSVDVDPGKVPEYDVDGPEVEVKTETKEVEVPDVDVHMEKKQVEVPDVDVKMPDEQPEED